jgi:hypothetical protein
LFVVSVSQSYQLRVFYIAHNGLQLGDVADLEALTFNLALNFI